MAPTAPRASASSKGASTVRFGEFRLDLSQQRLYGAEGEITLKPRARGALACLVERHGQIVSKDDLLRSAWDNTFVSDEAIAQRIMDIRHALRDDPKLPKYIRTHPRLGYEFIAELSELKPADATVLKPKRRSPLAILAILATAGLVVVGSILARHTTVPVSNLRLVRLTSGPGLKERGVPIPRADAVLYTSWKVVRRIFIASKSARGGVYN